MKYGSKMGGGKMKSAPKSKGKGSVYGAIKVVGKGGKKK